MQAGPAIALWGDDRFKEGVRACRKAHAKGFYPKHLTLFLFLTITYAFLLCGLDLRGAVGSLAVLSP